MKDVLNLFRENAEYDGYANREWLDYVVNANSVEATKIFKHILAASTVWVTRLEGVSLSAMPDIELSEASLDVLKQRWQTALFEMNLDAVIDYHNTKGEPFSLKVSEIARHAVNHGTYHRGQLREIFGNKGVEFPETDFVGFVLKRNQKSKLNNGE